MDLRRIIAGLERRLRIVDQQPADTHCSDGQEHAWPPPSPIFRQVGADGPLLDPVTRESVTVSLVECTRCGFIPPPAEQPLIVVVIEPPPREDDAHD